MLAGRAYGIRDLQMNAYKIFNDLISDSSADPQFSGHGTRSGRVCILPLLPCFPTLTINMIPSLDRVPYAMCKLGVLISARASEQCLPLLHLLFTAPFRTIY